MPLPVADDLQLAVGKGCLAGLALTTAFFLVGGLLYLAVRSLGLERGLSLVIALAVGPVVVSALVLGTVVRRAQRHAHSPAPQTDDAAATRDDA